MDEYTQTWFSTILLAIHKRRGGYANDLARDCNCSTSTFRKYAEMLQAAGEIAIIRYGTTTYPDNRYYLLTDATKEFCEPLQSLLEWVNDMTELANSNLLATAHGTNEHSRFWGEHTGLWKTKREILRRLDLLHRVAVRVGNS